MRKEESFSPWFSQTVDKSICFVSLFPNFLKESWTYDFFLQLPLSVLNICTHLVSRWAQVSMWLCTCTFVLICRPETDAEDRNSPSWSTLLSPGSFSQTQSTPNWLISLPSSSGEILTLVSGARITGNSHTTRHLSKWHTLARKAF